MKHKVLIIVRKESPHALQAREEVVKWLKSRSFEVMDVTDSDDMLNAERLEDIRLGVVIGGDGTFLGLVRRLQKKDQFPLMGVNLGTLGFITETGPDEMLSVMENVFKGKCVERLRLLLNVELWREKKCIQSGMVFNDIVISKDARTSLLKFEVYVGGEFFKHVGADGYIISTPTGSTAYCLSAHGPLLHPQVNGLVLVPICAHNLSARPVVVPQDMEIELRFDSITGAVYLVYDGQINYEILPEDRIKVKSSDTSLRLVGSTSKKWSETIRTKLNMM